MSVPVMKRLFLALALLLALGTNAPARAQDEGDDQEDGASAELKKIQEQQNKAVEELNAKQYDKALPRLEKLLATIEKSSLPPELKKAEERLTQYNRACGLSLTEKKEDALKAFDRSLELGFWDWKHISEDTDLNNIRNDDAFKACVTKWKEIEADGARVEAKKALAGEPLFELDPEMKLAGTKLKDMKGKVVVLALFVSQIPDCVTQLENLALVDQRAKAKGVSIYGLSFDRGGDTDLAAFAEEHGIKFDLSPMTAKHPLAKAVKGLRSFPATLIIDRDGKARILRQQLTSSEALDAMLKTFLEVGEDSRKDEPRKDEPRKDEPKKDEPKKDEPKKDEPF